MSDHPDTPADSAAAVDEHTQRALLDAEDIGFYFARIMQWIALHPEITHTAFRVYAVMRALYIKRRDMRTLSKDQLRYLVPGVRGKPMGRTALEDALKILERFGLITNPDGKSQTWRIRDPETKQFVSQTKHNWVLASVPVEGEDFDGWRNVFDKLDAYREDWETYPPTPPDMAVERVRPDEPDEEEDPGEGQRRKSGDGPHQTDEPSPPPTTQPADDDESAGRSQRRKSGTAPRKSGSRPRKSGNGSRKSGKPEPVTSKNGTPKKGTQEEREEELQDQDEGGRPPSNPPAPAADAAGTNNPGNSAFVGITQRKFTRNQLHAHARKLAGPLACAAIDRNPDIAVVELERLIVEANPDLTQAQVVGRARTLHAWEHRPPPNRAAGLLHTG